MIQTTAKTVIMKKDYAVLFGWLGNKHMEQQKKTLPVSLLGNP